jgi:uncharacterized protein (DUF2236 family)
VDNDRFFSPDMMFWQVDREIVLLLAGGRALLMQLAHPKIAAGVADHSHFKQDPLGRLYRTMSTMWSITFGEISEARLALDRVKNVHRQVHGEIKPAESLPAGTPYDAFDEELLLWVHATLIDSAMVGYDLFVRPLTQLEKSRYYEDSKKLAELFEIRSAIVPSSLEEFNNYVERMLAGNAIAVGPTARSLAKEILRPKPWILRPGAPWFRLVTAGSLPEGLRTAYGVNWSGREEKMFRLVTRVIRFFLPLVPKPLRIVPNARRAERHFDPRNAGH